MNTIKKYRKVLLRIIDILVIVVSYYVAEFISNEKFLFTEELNNTIINTIIIGSVVYLTVLNFCKTYENITRYENGMDYLIYVFACFSSCIIIALSKFRFLQNIVSIRTNIIASLIIITGIIGYRVLLRIILTEFPKHKDKDNTNNKNVLIIGAGDAARILIRTLNTTMRDTYNIVGLIDDDINKVNYAISGNKILGTRNEISKICKENNVELILFSISNISNEERKNILHICQDTGCKVRILPGTKDLIRNKSLMDNFRDVEIEDLLGRETIKLNNKDIGPLIKNKVVLVTGGGGSIGSELCRQILKFEPEKLVIVDVYENNLYDIEQELIGENTKTKIEAIVASVRDKNRLNEIFAKFNPYLVFHAAAHKHVPLMETSPLEAIKNNVFGTYNVVNCADEYNVKRFILISTDKAVNPTNIMGATKRLCEMIVQAKNKVSKTEYAAVRFGNVLGSNGSVIPLFKKQIAKGGPITVTHKDITRFFMTIPEAVSLVLQAMSYAKGGEIFVLDMGEPVKIYDMAVNLIKLSGYEPNVDIEIKITGLRPGEKIYEEILMTEEGLQATKHDKIHITKPMNINMQIVEDKLEKLKELIESSSNEEHEKIKDTMKELVPTYKEVSEINKTEEIETNNTNKKIEKLKLIISDNKEAIA